MATERRDEILEVLECDRGVRPKAAPGIDALIQHVLGVWRTPGALLVEFDPNVDQTLAAFVEAERLCCADLGWDIEREPFLRLRITAGEPQIDAIQSLWKPSK